MRRRYKLFTILLMFTFIIVFIGSSNRSRTIEISYSEYSLSDRLLSSSSVTVLDCDTNTGWSTTGGDSYRTWGYEQAGRTGVLYEETATGSNYYAYHAIGSRIYGVCDFWVYRMGITSKASDFVIMDQDDNLMIALHIKDNKLFYMTSGPVYHELVSGVTMNDWIRIRIEWDASGGGFANCDEDKYHVYLEDQNLFADDDLHIVGINCSNYGNSDETYAKSFGSGLIWSSSDTSNFVLDTVRIGDQYDNMDEAYGFGWVVGAADVCDNGDVNLTLYVITAHVGLLYDSWQRITVNASLLGCDTQAPINDELTEQLGNYTWINQDKGLRDTYFTDHEVLQNRTGGVNNYTNDVSQILIEATLLNGTYNGIGFTIWVKTWNYKLDEWRYKYDIGVIEIMYVENGVLTIVGGEDTETTVFGAASSVRENVYETLGSIQTFIKLLEKWYGDNWYTVWSTCIGGGVSLFALSNRQFRNKLKRTYYNAIHFIGKADKKRKFKIIGK